MHLDLDDAVALAGLAAPAFHVEGEAPRTVAALARHRTPANSSRIGVKSAV